MLKDEDRIFKNLYNDLGADLNSSKKEVIGQTLKIYVRKVETGLLMRLKNQN